VSEQYSDDVLRELVLGTIDSQQLRAVQRRKDGGRFPRVRALEQDRVPWPDRILVPLQEHLYVVDAAPLPVVKCRCGHEFGEYRRNWKDEALVYERDAQDGEIFLGPRGAPAEWVVLREFYCPGCAAQLDVEVVPVGYPFVHNFVPDLDALPDFEAER
jgi:acetone carboxylase, gamma subunit